MRDRRQAFSEKRAFIRLEHVFPVEFQFLDMHVEGLAVWYQAFTQDINEGGLCLTVNHLDENAASLLEAKKSPLLLHINIPLGKESVTATGRPVWAERIGQETSIRYLVGIAYDRISIKDNTRIMRYVKTRKFVKALAITLAVVLSLGVVAEGYYNKRLRYENEHLLRSLSVNVEAQKNLIGDRNGLEAQIEELEFLLSQSERKSDVLRDQLLKVSDEDQKLIAALNQSLAGMRQYQEGLKNQLTGLMTQKVDMEEKSKVAAREENLLEKQISDKLYRWLLAHQNHHTGLVASFEGDEDTEDLGFTYDQSLAAVVFLKRGDVNRAKQIFDFFLSAGRVDSGAVANAYYVSSGDVAEYIAHAGPNIWLALAICRYADATGDLSYMGFVREIETWLGTLKDADAGLRGGANLGWYSTEHNLDAYALYRMLSRLTGEEAYQEKAKKTLNWLNKNAYSKIHVSVVKRGKGDATIATDTYAWSIASVGPETLKEIGMDPDGIMDFAIQNCAITVEYRKPDGPFVKVKGFDFAKHQNMARGGVVSCEWTSQMIVSLKIMADYHASLGNAEKEQYYRQLAQEYISEMSKMIITSLSPVGQGEFCLPYASHEFADTGHGWRTPKGDRTGSIAGTAYYFLAMEGVNPLQLRTYTISDERFLDKFQGGS